MSLVDGLDLARIPGRDFLMGSGDGEPDERPLHRVRVSEFLIGRQSVRNADYARFVRESGYPAPEVRDLPLVASDGFETMFRELAAPYEWRGGEPPPGRARHPVVLIRYGDAVAYCDWMSQATGRQFRLPTEAEWECAARGGVDGRRYPWGDEITGAHGNFLARGLSKHDRGTSDPGRFA